MVQGPGTWNHPPKFSFLPRLLHIPTHRNKKIPTLSGFFSPYNSPRTPNRARSRHQRSQPVSPTVKHKSDTLGCINIKHFKDAVKKTRRQVTDQEKTTPARGSVGGLVGRMQEEVRNSAARRTARLWKRTTDKQAGISADTHTNGSLAPAATRGCACKPRSASARMCRTGNPRALSVGPQTGAATMEDGVWVPQKLKNRTAL